jgi:serine/threonine protein kinase
MDIKQLIGVTLGTCILERVIGRGGMGAVFLAQQSRPVRTVAVKVLIPAFEESPDVQEVFLTRFQREADTVAKLEHKNILPIYEYDEAVVDGQPLAYLVMPFIRGGTLRERIDEMKREGQQFDLKVVASYISQIAEALSYAHGFGIVHRDVKPGNLLFHQDGRLLLSDFGIVRLNGMPTLTSVGSFLGTAEYASPEQVSGGEVDFRSDIYSLGIILYELLAGHVPFTGPNPFVVMSRHLNEPVLSIRDSRPDLSPAVESMVMKALAKNPDDRYQSATHMALAFRKAISSAVLPASAMHLGGDGSNTETTVVDPAQQIPSTPSTPSLPANAVPSGGPISAIAPTTPIPSVRPPGGTSLPPWHMMPPAAGAGYPQGAPLPGTVPLQPQPEPASPAKPIYHQGRRLYYYSVALIALLLQFVVFFLLYAPARDGVESPAILGVLLGTGINLLILAAIGFTGVTRSRDIRKFLNTCLIIAIIAPLLSAFFVNFGVDTQNIHPLVAYLILLISNIVAIRQLASVDAPREQVLVAPVLWRSAFVGALTGLLPLTIILIFALVGSPAIFSSLLGKSLLLRLFGVLLVAFIGAPTPGAVLAVWLSEKMTFPVLLRSTAVAGVLMFLGAFLLVVLWDFAFANHKLFFDHFGLPLITLFLEAGILAVIGLLRGMLDVWVYRRIMKRTQ